MNIELAKKEFKNYLEQYDKENYKIKQKMIHTYHVAKMSKYLAEKLNLSNQQIELAELIGLLHDIGRFEQLKQYNSTEDYNTMDHAVYGVKVLFEDNLIRKFIKEDKFDEIIYKAIINHNKFEIEKDEMNGEELLQSKLIRDSDKIDNFRLQAEEDPASLLLTQTDKLEKEEITKEVYQWLIEQKLVIFNRRKTNVDKWISLVGFLYDLNFKESLEYIKEKGYLTKAIHKIDYKNLDTIEKVKQIEKVANEYMMQEKKENY